MADQTKIEWTDATWNIVTGCSVVSPGCTNCYAMRLAGTRLKHHPSREGLTRDTKAGPAWTGKVRFNPQWLDQPLRWKTPRMIFVAAHGDLFADGVTDEQLDKIFAVMALCPQHIFQVLTKRPERMRAYLHGERDRRIAGQVVDFALQDKAMMARMVREIDDKWPVISEGDPEWPDGIRVRKWPLPNVWLGVSVEDQKRAEERIPILLKAPAALRWVSAEPLLGPVDLTSAVGGTLWMGGQRGCNGHHQHNGAPGSIIHGMLHEMDPRKSHHHHDQRCGKGIDWVVAGGESGTRARPMHPHWAYALRDQCAAAEVPFLFKQWGNWIVASQENGHHDGSMATNDAIWLDVDGRRAKPSCNGMAEPIGMFRITKSRAGRLLAGVEHNAFPPLPAHFKEHADDQKTS